MSSLCADSQGYKLSWDKGLREFDIFVKHHTDPYGDIICPGSEKSNR